MMDLHEYAYAKTSPVETNEGFQIICRYCDSKVIKMKQGKGLEESIEELQRFVISHLMMCKPFHEVKKSEIEECGL